MPDVSTMSNMEAIVVLVFIVVFTTGYVLNIRKFVEMDHVAYPADTLVVARAVGLILAPLGAILGFMY